MLANGPQWTKAGCPSSVWTRLGFNASLSSTAIDPAALSCYAVTGSPSYVCPIVIAPSRARRSARSRETATRPMISLAAVMSKPGRPERRLAQAERRLLPDPAEALRQRHGRRRLSLARRRRRDRGDVDQLPVGPVGETLENGKVDLRLVASV